MSEDTQIPSFGARSLVPSPSDEKEHNPSLSQEDRIADQAFQRIPMSAPMAKLTTPDIPGYHLHWINDYPGRINQAIRAGYQFVEQEEVHVNSRDIAGDRSEFGGTDLGTRVSIVVGTDDKGKELRGYLMKIRSEWYTQDQSVIQDRIDGLYSAMREGKQNTGGSDGSNRYVKTANFQTQLRKG